MSRFTDRDDYRSAYADYCSAHDDDSRRPLPESLGRADLHVRQAERPTGRKVTAAGGTAGTAGKGVGR